MRMYWRPSDKQVVTFLQAVQMHPPVFIHCRRGEDRTGVMTAIYRVAKQGWQPERAYAEARLLGLSGLNPFMRDVILRETTQEYVTTVATQIP